MFSSTPLVSPVVFSGLCVTHDEEAALDTAEQKHVEALARVRSIQASLVPVGLRKVDGGGARALSRAVRAGSSSRMLRPGHALLDTPAPDVVWPIPQPVPHLIGR